MKKNLALFVLPLLLIFGTTSALQTPFVCPSTELKNDLKPLLKPDYKYDSSKITRIKINGEEDATEIEVPLFIGEKYKFIFNTESLSKDVIISVYNKKMGKNNRELLYTNKDERDGKKTIFSFEPDKSRTMYINYEIPKGAASSESCAVFLLGYRI